LRVDPRRTAANGPLQPRLSTLAARALEPRERFIELTQVMMSFRNPYIENARPEKSGKQRGRIPRSCRFHLKAKAPLGIALARSFRRLQHASHVRRPQKNNDRNNAGEDEKDPIRRMLSKNRSHSQIRPPS